MGLKLAIAATEYPVTLAEAKAHLNVDFDDDDAIIEIYRKAANGYAEGFTGRAFVDQTWNLYLDAFPTQDIKIPKPPLIEVEGVFYTDGNGDEREFATTAYMVDDKRSDDFAWIILGVGASWPSARESANAVRIQFRAGYVDLDVSPVSGEVPYEIKAAILLMIGTLYANRETIIVGTSALKMPWAAEELMSPYRVHVAIA